MNLHVIGCSFRTAPVALRERLAIPETRVGPTLAELLGRFGGEALVLSTCNRLEIYLVPDAPVDVAHVAGFLAEWQKVPTIDVQSHLYEHQDADAARHLFRVAASLDSLIVGEGQIAGQVKRAYETATQCAAVGPLLHVLLQHARVVVKRVRHETGVARGHVSVSSVAVDYVRQVFDHFHDKTILVIGAGKMGELALKHLRDLRPRKIVVTNRSPEKALSVALGCGGQPAPWSALDNLLSKADVVLSTTGAPEPIMSAERFAAVLARRSGGPMVILDIAVPRDFDPAIHDGDRVCLFNIDDLSRVRESTLADRLAHVAPAEAIVEQETRRFMGDWARRRHGAVIAQLTEDCDRKRRAVLGQLLSRLNGRLSEADKQTVEGAFRLLQNQFLHGPISALGEASREDGGSTLLEALRQLFRLRD